MVLIDVLIDTDDAASGPRKTFKRVRVDVALRPFELGVVNAVMLGKATEFVVLRLVGQPPNVSAIEIGRNGGGLGRLARVPPRHRQKRSFHLGAAGRKVLN